MKVYSFLFILFIFILHPIAITHAQKIGEYGKKRIAAKELLEENTTVQGFFRSLKKEEKVLLNTILEKHYLLGYYAELKLSKLESFFEFEEHLFQIKEDLRTLKEGGQYHTILHKARGASKVHLLRYIIRREEYGAVRGNMTASALQIRKPDEYTLKISDTNYWNGLFFGEVYVHISGEYWTPLDPKEVFLPVPKKIKIDIIDINWNKFGKIFLASLFLSAVIAAIILLIGACYLPQKNVVFGKIRTLLEY